MRSVVVVLPASMCAMMPMFLQRSNGTVLDTAFFFSSFRTSCSPTMFTGLLIELLLSAIGLYLLASVSGRLGLCELLAKKLTTCSAQRPCSLRPCGAHLPFS